MSGYSVQRIKNRIYTTTQELLYRENLKFEKQYWSIQEKHINENGKDYYVIRRRGAAGLFSLYITTLAQIKVALDRGLIPVVDLMNYRNTYMGLRDVGNYNPWELFFCQPFDGSISEMEKNARNVYYCGDEMPRIRPSDNTEFLYSLADKENIWRRMTREYIKVQPSILESICEEYSQMSNGGTERILGVLCRGTDYVRLKPKEHPIQPSLEEMFEKADEIMKEYRCEKLFLATEDASYEKEFKKKYGDSLLTIDEEKIRYTGGYLSGAIMRLSKDEKILAGINYLKKILLLSKCQCFVAGRTSGTVGVMLQEHDFEYTYFFDKGRYL